MSRAGLADLLRQAAHTVGVAAAVAREILARGPRDLTAVALASSTWLKQVEDPAIPPGILAWDLGDGESSVLAWALAHPGTRAVIDDLEGRRCADALGIPLRGTVVSAAKTRYGPRNGGDLLGARVAGDQERGTRQGKRLFLNRRPQAGTSARSVRVQIPVLVIHWYSRAVLRETVKALLAALCDLFRSRSALLAENTLLRQQVILLHRATPHPRLKARDRFTIGAITKLFPSLVAAVPIVRPDTVLRWHRSLWKLIWRRRSRRPVGRPPIDADTRALIRRMWTENPLWGEDVIAAELAKLGHHVSPRTVAKYRPARLPRGRGQKWSTFIRNHLGQAWAADWFTIVTVRFQILYAFVILDLRRREILRVGVTSTPSAQYAAQSFVEAVCDRDDQAPRFLIHDRDSLYGAWFRRRVKGFGTRCLATPPRAPQANSYCERVIRTIRRGYLDNTIIVDERHAERLLREYVRYYHGRPHRGLHTQAPLGAHWLPPMRPASASAARSVPVLGGLHYEYTIAA